MMVCQSEPPAVAPLPRLTALAMLSLGTLFFLAFWMASTRVGLPARSPPPLRAATSMFLIILPKSLPRLASTTAFWCLVVAHLEWPLIVSPSTNERHLPNRLETVADPTDPSRAFSAGPRGRAG